MARGRGSGKKSGSKPTTSKRNHKQDVKQRYSELREEAQLLGLIPTTPEGAVRNEVANTFGHAYDGLPELIKQAIRENWATPDKAKPAIIAALLEPFFKTQTVLDIDGKEVQVKPSPALLMSLANTLRMLDVVQYERDHPDLAGQAKGGTQINNNNTQTTGIVNGEVFDDITKLETSIGHIIQDTSEGGIRTEGGEHTDSKATSGLREDRNAEPLDVAQPNKTEEEPKAD